MSWHFLSKSHPSLFRLRKLDKKSNPKSKEEDGVIKFVNNDIHTTQSCNLAIPFGHIACNSPENEEFVRISGRKCVNNHVNILKKISPEKRLLNGHCIFRVGGASESKSSITPIRNDEYTPIFKIGPHHIKFKCIDNINSLFGTPKLYIVGFKIPVRMIMDVTIFDSKNQKLTNFGYHATYTNENVEDKDEHVLSLEDRKSTV